MSGPHIAPFRTDTEDIVRQTHRQVVRAVATHSSFPSPITLDIQDGTLGWDETRAPRVRATLRCKVPADQATLDSLDPRAGVRVVISAGYVRPGGIEDVQVVADLGLRSRRVQRPGNVMELEAASDEALVIDASPSVVETITAASVPLAVQGLVYASINPRPYVEIRTTAGAASVAVNPVTDRWETIRDLIDRAGIQVYDDGTRRWAIEARPELVGDTAAVLKVGANGTVETSDTGLDRDGWSNYVLLRYTWRDATTGAEQRVNATAYVSTGTYAITGDSGRKIYAEDRDVQTTQAEANSAAGALLARQITRGRSLSLTAVSMWWLRPGMTVSVQTPLGSPERHLVSAVSFDLATDRMSVVTRMPLATTYVTATTTPPAQAPAPDPAPPVTQTYVTTWEANLGASYRGDGTKRNDTTDLVQGYSPSAPSNGNQEAVALFTSASSTGSETNKTIVQALTGATVTKVEVWLYYSHWHYNNPTGGTARVGWAALSSIPTTYTAAAPSVSVAGWQRGEGRWVEITSATHHAALAAGNRGITVGPGAGTDPRYYGRAVGPAETSNRPRLRITYVK